MKGSYKIFIYAILFMSIPFFVFLGFIGLTCYNGYIKAKNTPEYVKILNSNFDLENIMETNRNYRSSLYSGIAISKKEAIKIKDYNSRFCDNDYCYYLTPMFYLVSGTRGGPYFVSYGIRAKYTFNGYDYLAYGFHNIPTNESQNHFNISCFAIDCQIKSKIFYFKNYIYFDIKEINQVKHYSNIKLCDNICSED